MLEEALSHREGVGTLHSLTITLIAPAPGAGETPALPGGPYESFLIRKAYELGETVGSIAEKSGS